MAGSLVKSAREPAGIHQKLSDWFGAFRQIAIFHIYLKKPCQNRDAKLEKEVPLKVAE